MTLPVPSASSGAEIFADWLELNALKAADRNMSFQDLVGAIRRTGSADDLDAEEEEDYPRGRRRRDIGSERSQSVAADAFAEIERRSRFCGTRIAYPYKLGSDYVQAHSRSDASLYVFLLLVSHFCEEDPAALAAFEDLSAHAAATYLGGPSDAAVGVPFGFPRRHLPTGFGAAVDELCKMLGEGDGYYKSVAGERQKDGKLDVVVWRAFADARAGKVIGFGQCATGGSGWRMKLPELHPEPFTGMFLRRQPVVTPVRMFFVPWRCPETTWEYDSRMAGVIFDRCRLVELARRAPNELQRKYQRWSATQLRKLRRLR